MSVKKGTGYQARLRYLLMLSVITGLMCISTHVFAQTAPPPGPPPPPPPDELFKKINPFKKHKKDTINKKVDTTKNNQVSQPAGPPPPPNPLKLFKKKKRDTTKSGNN